MGGNPTFGVMTLLVFWLDAMTWLHDVKAIVTDAERNGTATARDPEEPAQGEAREPMAALKGRGVEK